MIIETRHLNPDPHGLNRLDYSVRIPEKSEIFTRREVRKYIKGCDYPKSADDLLLALEMQGLFTPFGIRSMRILDAMCGPGRLGREFLELGAPHVVFLDGHETMINHAKDEAAKVRQSGQIIDSVMSDVASTPFRDHVFDLVICHNSIHQLSDFDRLGETMREFVRITAPGGTVVIADFQRPETIALKKAASIRLDVTHELVRELLKDTYGACFSKDEFREAIQSIPGIGDWSVIDAQEPKLTRDMWKRVDEDPIKGHLMDYSPVSLRAIVRKK